MDKVVSSAGGFTNTLRLQHRAPVVNLPGVEAEYGEWCRGVLVSPDDDHVLCGADVSSLEDMTKRHYIKPLDPQFVDDMSRDGYDAHLDLALHAGAVTQEDIDKHNSGEINLKPLRSKFKAANYSCVYGVGAPKLARETGMREKEAKALIDAYWDRNWAVKKVAKQQYVKTLKDGSMWLKNGVSGFYHNLRYDKDRWSTTNQSTGVYVFDMWVMFCRRMGLVISCQYHDEILFTVKKGDEERVSKVLHEAMAKVNETLKLNVTIEVEEKYGRNYAEVH
jgi:DNA polymerase I-like protein with 3'-5' exonuclease and polymerase domains